MPKNLFKKNEFFSSFKQPTIEIYEKKEMGRKDWRLPYRKSDFQISTHFRTKSKSINKPNWTYFSNWNLSDLLPKSHPYVPKLFQYLVNRIERDLCFGNVTINEYSSPIDFSHPSAEIIKDYMFQVDKDEIPIEKYDSFPITWIINMLKLTLIILKRKPLIISRKAIEQIMKQPLSDKYHRPNLNIKPIISDICFKLSKVCCDTLSFLMIHIIHFWKYDYAPTPAKVQLAEIFGVLLITFELEDLTTDDITKGPEAALLEVILEVCDYQFWYQLSHHSVLRLFENILIESSNLRQPTADRPIHLSPISYFIGSITKSNSNITENE